MSHVSQAKLPKILPEVPGGMCISVKNQQKTIPVDARKIKQIVREVLTREGRDSSGEINLGFVSDQQMRRLNFRYLGINSATDVLAFDLSDTQDKIIADIFISTQTAATNAKIFNSRPLHELYLYVIHGLLHILGYDDLNEKERLVMREKEKEYLSRWLS